MAKDIPIYKRGDCWYVRIPLGGGRYDRKSLGKVSNKEAIEIAERMISSHGKDALFDDVAERWLVQHVAKRKRGTRSAYRAAMLSFADTFEGMRLSEIDRGAIGRWERAMRDAGRISGSTMNSYLAALSSMFRWCAETDIADIQSPVSSYMVRASARPDATAIKPGAPRTRYLTEDDEDKLLSAIGHAPPMSGAEAIRNAIILSIDVGFRREELLGLEWDYVDLTRAQVTIPSHLAKYSKERRVPLLRRSHALLAEMRASATGKFVITKHVKTHGPTRYDSFDRRFGLLIHAAGLGDVRWHDLRRTCGCRLLQGSQRAGLKPQRIEVVSKWLGHSNIAITQKSYAFLGVDNLHSEVGTQDWLRCGENS